MILKASFDDRYQGYDLTDPCSVKSFILSGKPLFNYDESELIVPCSDPSDDWIYEIVRYRLMPRKVSEFFRDHDAAHGRCDAMGYWRKCDSETEFAGVERIPDDELDELCLEVSEGDGWFDAESKFECMKAFLGIGREVF